MLAEGSNALPRKHGQKMVARWFQDFAKNIILSYTVHIPTRSDFSSVFLKVTTHPRTMKIVFSVLLTSHNIACCFVIMLQH